MMHRIEFSHAEPAKVQAELITLDEARYDYARARTVGGPFEVDTSQGAPRIVRVTGYPADERDLEYLVASERLARNSREMNGVEILTPEETQAAVETAEEEARDAAYEEFDTWEEKRVEEANKNHRAALAKMLDTVMGALDRATEQVVILGHVSAVAAANDLRSLLETELDKLREEGEAAPEVLTVKGWTAYKEEQE